MGLLNMFGKSEQPKLERLPSGSFTLDRTGRIVASTLPGSYPVESVRAIGDLVLAIFQSTAEVNMPLREINLTYSAVKIKAKELRGGAMIFLTPRTK